MLPVAGFGLGFGNSIAPAPVIGFGALLTLANYWFSAAFHAYQAELFPTRLRATGVGFTYSWSRLSAAFTSLLIGALLVYGVPLVFAVLAAAMVRAAAVVGIGAANEWGAARGVVEMKNLGVCGPRSKVRDLSGILDAIGEVGRDGMEMLQVPGADDLGFGFGGAGQE